MEIKIPHASPVDGVSDLIARKVPMYTGVHGTTTLVFYPLCLSKMAVRITFRLTQHHLSVPLRLTLFYLVLGEDKTILSSFFHINTN